MYTICEVVFKQSAIFVRINIRMIITSLQDKPKVEKNHVKKRTNKKREILIGMTTPITCEQRS
jgi:hypothetical protein